MADAATGFAYALPVGLAALGVLLLGVGVLRTVRRKAFTHRALPATATVVQVVEERRKKAARYFADLQYTPAGATSPVQFRSSLSTDEPYFEEGQAVEILYNPIQPTEAFVADFWHLWFWPIFLLAMGAAMAALGGWMVRDLLVFRG